jgi:hypothetical protein
MDALRSMLAFLAPVITALLCTLPWLAPGVGAALDGLDLALPGAVAGLALLATIVASARRTPREPFDAAGWWWALPSMTLLGVAPIAVAWATARSNGAFLAGVFPYSDAGDYVQGALNLLAEGRLDAWNSRRPLNAALFAARLALVDLSVERALVLQALLLALSVTLAARAVALDYGRRAGLTLGAGVMVFGAIYTPTTLSEPLGLTLGALGMATLWHAARTGHRGLLGAGMFTLTAALNARSGPFFALGTLLLWAAWDARRRGLRGALGALGAGALGSVAAFAFNSALLRVHHGAIAGMHGNFSYTLYGLARGGVPWDRALTEHPEVTQMTDAEASAFLYARAAELIRSDPMGLLRGFAANVHELVAMVVDPLTGERLHGRPTAMWLVFATLLSPAAVAYAAALRKRPDDAAMRMSLAAAAGLALSVPVIFLDGRVRVFAAGFPLGLASFVAAVAALRGPDRANAPTHRDAARAPVALAAALVLASLVGAALGRRHPSVSTTSCPTGEDAFALWTDGDPMHRAITRGGGLARDGAVPEDTLDARIGRDANLGFTQLDAQLRALAPGDTVIAGLDVSTHRFGYYVFPRGMRRPRRAVIQGCVAHPDENIRQFRRVTRVR